MKIINIKQLIQDLIPAKLRTLRRISWINLLINQIDLLLKDFYIRYNDNMYILRHNGQVASLEHILNNKINLLGKPIFITDGEYIPQYYIGADGTTLIKIDDYYSYQDNFILYDPQHFLIGRDITTDLNIRNWISNNTDDINNIVDFYINVDYKDAPKIDLIKFYIDKYLIVGSTYGIKYY